MTLPATGLVPLTWDELAHAAHSIDPYTYKTQAVAYAVRAGHTDDIAARFLAQLCAMGMLGQPSKYAEMLSYVLSLQPDTDPLAKD